MENRKREAASNALRQYTQAHGSDAARALMHRVVGTEYISEIPEDRLGTIIAACNAVHKPGPRQIEDLEGEEVGMLQAKRAARPTRKSLSDMAASIYAKWNARPS